MHIELDISEVIVLHHPPVKKHRHILDHILIQCRSLYLALVKVTLVPSWQNLSMADCSLNPHLRCLELKGHGLRNYVIAQGKTLTILSSEVVLYGHINYMLF